MTQILLGKGAEAIVYLVDGKVEKQRLKKRYRHPDLDTQLRKTRTRQEARILEKLRFVVPVPELLEIDENTMTLVFSHVDGELVRFCLDRIKEDVRASLFFELGRSVAAMHDRGIVHGDLTTSNLIFQKGTFVIIDFGLAYVTQKIESMAVDLHVFRQALESAHYTLFSSLWQSFLKGYLTWNGSKEVLDRLDHVEQRGRYKRRGD